MSAPERIYATVNGQRTRNGTTSYLIGGWEEMPQGDRSSSYIRADVAQGMIDKAVDDALERAAINISTYAHTYGQASEWDEVGASLERAGDTFANLVRALKGKANE